MNSHHPKVWEGWMGTGPCVKHTQNCQKPEGNTLQPVRFYSMRHIGSAGATAQCTLTLALHSSTAGCKGRKAFLGRYFLRMSTFFGMCSVHHCYRWDTGRWGSQVYSGATVFTLFFLNSIQLRAAEEQWVNGKTAPSSHLWNMTFFILNGLQNSSRNAPEQHH